MHGHLTSVSRDEYDTCFDGTDQAVAIAVGHPWRLDEPPHLGQLRTLWPEFRPPQSYRYIDRSIVAEATTISPRLRAMA